MDHKRMKSPDGSGYLGPVNCWKALGMAIVRQVIIDWQRSVLLMTQSETANRNASAMKNSCEAFLKSSKCEFYSGLDGPTLLRKMKEETL